MLSWLSDHDVLLAWLFVISVVMFVGTLIVLPIMIVRMPADYFLHRRPPPESWRARHVAIRWGVVIVKNLIGIVLVVAGFIMLIVPGQGILSIVIGVSLLDLPGKRYLELRLVQNRHVMKAINWIRAKYHRPPLKLPGNVAVSGGR